MILAPPALCNEPIIIPQKTLKVIVVDDNEDQIVGILKLLRLWPNLQVEAITPKEKNFVITIPEGAHIVLLDYDLGCNQTSECIYHELKSRKSPPKIIASISGSEDMLPGMHSQFKGKTNVGEGLGRAGIVLFIRFMNEILKGFQTP